MTAKVFIDGEAGTTGLQIRQRLEKRRDLQVLSIDAARRKDPAARAELMNESDAVILCLPDDSAKEAVKLVTNAHTVIIDASTAHRVDPHWVYGFAEMADGHRVLIQRSKRISNPGCYPTGFVGLAPTRHGVDQGPSARPLRQLLASPAFDSTPAIMNQPGATASASTPPLPPALIDCRAIAAGRPPASSATGTPRASAPH